MKYYIVLYPDELIFSVLEESKKIQEKIYNKPGSGIYFRVKTTNKLTDSHRLFFRGKGHVIVAQARPHISLIHNIELPDSKKESFFLKIAVIAKKYKSFNLNFEGVGNYDQSFTFFLKFKINEGLSKMREEILAVSKSFLTVEEYNQHTEVVYVPHITILYDDMEPKKIEAAQKLLDVEKFKKPVLINNLQIWEVSPTEQKTVKIINLS